MASSAAGSVLLGAASRRALAQGQVSERFDGERHGIGQPVRNDRRKVLAVLDVDQARDEAVRRLVGAEGELRVGRAVDAGDREPGQVTEAWVPVVDRLPQ